MKQLKLLSLLAALIFATGVWAQCSFTATVDASSMYEPTQIQNGGFDVEPQLKSPATDQGWNTTDNRFEWMCGVLEWHTPEWNDDEENCKVEMNAEDEGTLYQDLSTNGGDVIRWSLDHAVRYEPDDSPETQSIRVEIGAPNYSGSNIIYPSGTGWSINTQINDNTKATFRSSGIENPAGKEYGFDGHDLGNLSLNKDLHRNAWYNTTGVYVIPDNQPVTRFAFVSEGAEDWECKSCGNLMDNIVFSTLIGDMSATYGAGNSVVIKGYWGDDNYPYKKLKVVINGTTFDVNMNSVFNKNFTVTIPYSCIGENYTEISYYHESYPSAARTIKVNQPMTVSATGVHVDYDGNPHSITVNVTEPASDYTIKYGTSYGGCTLTENPAYTTKGTYDVYYQVSKAGYTTAKGKATVQIDAVMLNLTVLTNNSSMGSTLKNDILFEDDFSSTSSLPSGWNTGSLAWSVSAGKLKSGAADDQTSELRAQYTLAGPGSISFKYRISSENSFDYGHFSIDGVTKFNVCGSSENTVQYDLSAGTHTFRWWYDKDGSYGEGDDALFIDDISITSLAATGTDPIAIESGSTFNLIAQPNSGYGFVNWTDGGENVLGTNETLAVTLNSNMTAQANFAHLWTVSYAASDKTGGTVPTDNTEHLDGASVTVKSGVPTKYGYTFAGWLNSVDGNTYTAGQNFSITANTTLTAQWDAADMILNDNDNTLPTILSAINDGEARNITMNRPLLRNGDYNTICLPFDLSYAQLHNASNPLYNCTVSQLTDMWVAGNELRIYMSPVNSMVAGKPYLVRYNGEADNLAQMVFNNVTIGAAEGTTTNANGATMYGILEPTHLTVNDQNLLFLVAGNELKWPNADNAMKAFRAYFVLGDYTPSGAPIRRGMRARIVEQRDAATGIDGVQQSAGSIQKFIENGQLIIEANGVRYNAQGQVIK